MGRETGEAVTPNVMDNLASFDVLLSFAGPERHYARAIYDICTANGLTVFLDEEYQHEIWGTNLVEYLTSTYSERGRYCVILVSAAYCDRGFTRVERRAAFDAMVEQASEYILPVRVDDSKLPGLPVTTAYLDLRTVGVLGICEMLRRKVTGSTEQLMVPEFVRVPRIPLGKIPADQLSKHLLNLCQNQPVAVFGALVYDESTAEYRKLLIDDDYWDALNAASGPDFEVFALRDERSWSPDEGSERVFDLVTVASLSRSRSRGYYFSRLLKDFFGEEKTTLVYPSLILFIISSGEVVFSRLIPLSRGRIDETFQRLQNLFGLIARNIATWRLTGNSDASALWSDLKTALLNENFTLYIQQSPRAVGAAVAGLQKFFEK